MCIICKTLSRRSTGRPTITNKELKAKLMVKISFLLTFLNVLLPLPECATVITKVFKVVSVAL